MRHEIGDCIMYMEDGVLHRVDGPAYIKAGTFEEYYSKGKLHREDGPARVFANGSKEWWSNGEIWASQDELGNIRCK